MHIGATIKFTIIIFTILLSNAAPVFASSKICRAMSAVIPQANEDLSEDENDGKEYEELRAEYNRLIARKNLYLGIN